MQTECGPTYNLGRIQPGHAQPTPGEEGVEDEQEGCRHDTGAGLSLEARGDRQDNHGERHASGTDQHQGSTAHPLTDEDRQPGHEEILGAVAGRQDTRHQSRQVDVVLVDGGGIVGDEVDSGDLLEHLVDIGEHHPMEVTVFAHGEEILEASGLALQNRFLDGRQFVHHQRVVHREVQQRLQDVRRLVLTALENEPARRLGEKHDKGQDDEREDDLERDGEPPRDRAWVEEGESQVQPVTDADTTRDQSAFYHDERTTTVGLGALGLPGRDGRRIQTVADTSDNTTDDEVGQAECRRLKSRTDNHDGRAQEDGLATAQDITDEDTHDRTEETADIVRCDRDTWGPLIQLHEKSEIAWSVFGDSPWIVDWWFRSAGGR